MGRITLFGFLNYDPTIFDDIELPEACDKDTLLNTIISESGDLYPYYQQPVWLKRNIEFWFKRRKPNFERMFEALAIEYNPAHNYDRYEEYTNEHSEEAESANQSSQTDSHTMTNTGTVGNVQNETHTGTVTTDQDESHTGTVQNSDQNDTGVSAYNYTSNDYAPRDRVDSDRTRTDNLADTLDNTRTDNLADSITATRTDNLTSTDSGTTGGSSSGSSSATSTDSHEAHLYGNIGVTTSMAMIKEELELRKYDIYLEIAKEFEKQFLIQIY